MVFFQQSAVVDKNMQEKDMLWGRLDTAVGSLLTVVVAVGCVVLTGTLLPGQNISDAATAAIRFMGINKYVGAFLAIGLFDAGSSEPSAFRSLVPGRSVRFSAGRTH